MTKYNGIKAYICYRKNRRQKDIKLCLCLIQPMQSSPLAFFAYIPSSRRKKPQQRLENSENIPQWYNNFNNSNNNYNDSL